VSINRARLSTTKNGKEGDGRNAGPLDKGTAERRGEKKGRKGFLASKDRNLRGELDFPKQEREEKGWHGEGGGRQWPNLNNVENQAELFINEGDEGSY